MIPKTTDYVFRLHRILEDLSIGEQHLIYVLKLAKYNQLQTLQCKVEYLVKDIWKLEMEIKNKKSILAILDDIIRIDRIDGMSEERTREFYIKEGFRLSEMKE